MKIITKLLLDNALFMIYDAKLGISGETDYLCCFLCFCFRSEVEKFLSCWLYSDRFQRLHLPSSEGLGEGFYFRWSYVLSEDETEDENNKNKKKGRAIAHEFWKVFVSLHRNFNLTC